jgi:hypothetical protein
MHRVAAVHPTGNPDFPRFLIADSQGEVWTGESWSPDEDDAVVYANPKYVSLDCAALQRQETLDKPHLPTTPADVLLEVLERPYFDGQPFTAQELLAIVRAEKLFAKPPSVASIRLRISSLIFAKRVVRLDQEHVVATKSEVQS